ncbi:hypothetical protein pah_c268o014 [Parachlamydia acanthamoebae str. Hall's coccus]|nr:hypothetical protein pah_c268o014 [Parachlamydia acanthamoebae str. Hall's coccus]
MTTAALAGVQEYVIMKQIDMFFSQGIYATLHFYTLRFGG